MSDKGNRGLSTKFMAALKEGGILNPILKRVQQDDTLMLAIRDEYVDIYYRGGCLMNIKHSGDIYPVKFNEKYIVDNLPSHSQDFIEAVVEKKSAITAEADSQKWIEAMPHLKMAIDLHHGRNSKAEREFQQVVVRENNQSAISNETEYFIVDIEYARPKEDEKQKINARFDLVAIKWPAKQRKNGKCCRLAIIEMKYGDQALGGASGIKKHLDDINSFLVQYHNEFQNEMLGVFKSLRDLDLLKLNADKFDTIEFSEGPEIIMLLANHNPRSGALLKALNGIETTALQYDLRFFVSSFAGYGMHEANMLTLENIKKRLVT